MKNSSARLLLASALFACAASAQQPAARITAPIVNTDRVTLTGSHSPLADPALDLGAVPPAMKLQGMTLIFGLSPAQKSELDALVAAQTNPGSPLYHQWLTPETYAARFGAADSDIAAAEAWLQSQGFSIDKVARSRNRIFFSGNAAQVESAFGSPLHNFRSPRDGQAHYAPASDFTLPRALAPVVAAIGNVSSFKPHPNVKLNKPMPADGATSVLKPDFTSGQSGSHFTTPGDINTIYDVTPVYNAGYTGTGQTIVLIGQSEIYPSDVLNFQIASGITPAPLTPIYLLVPGTGTAYFSSGDEAESDLDVEYASTIGKGAQAEFIFTGNNTNYDVFDSLQYAVDNKIGTIISSSYGSCEPALGLTNYQILDAIVEQGAAQGQSILSAAGDDGSTDCYGDYSSLSSNTQLAVDYPASSAYATAMGGSEFLLADTSGSGASTYWSSNGTTDVVSSAKSYIPEQVWNDDAAEGQTASGGGGVSIFAARPSWQAGTFGGVTIPASSYRTVPDISLDASNYSASLLYCSSDPSTQITGSCYNGFRDANNQYLTTAGGTSFDGPIFAGMLAMINQAISSTNGQGLINPTLYTLAANATTYSTAFHDIATAGNQCLAGSSVCGTSTATVDYAATTGYDEASGLGSIDLYHLATSWPGYGAVAAPSISVTSPNSLSITPGTAASLTVTVTPYGGFTGTVALTVTASPTLAYACYALSPSPVSITGATAAPSTLTILTNQASCGTGYSPLYKDGTLHASNRLPAAHGRSLGNTMAGLLAGLCLAGLCFRRRKLGALRGLTLALFVLLGAAAMGLSGCSNTSAAASSTGAPNTTGVGNYSVTITGTSTTTSTITSSTTIIVNVL
jgi:subtilase family serine protease